MIDRICALYKKYRQPILYVFFGGGTTIVGVGSFLLFHSVLHIHELLANVYSWVLAVAFAYATSRKWVFCSRTKGQDFYKELIAFYAGRLVVLGVEESMLLIFVTCLAFPGTAVKLSVQVLVMIGNFVVSKFIVFRKKKDAQ
ncbi:MAG: GtrA family protein [Oscillospiraceae bacterium]|nr:GtrA family protein [Oscillospiraceae bacterium]